jgi:hypothetical protein
MTKIDEKLKKDGLSMAEEEFLRQEANGKQSIEQTMTKRRLS